MEHDAFRPAVRWVLVICASLTVPTSGSAQNYGLDIDRIRYSDTSGLAVDYGFSTDAAPGSATMTRTCRSCVSTT